MTRMKTIFAILAVGMLSACATTRSEISVPPQESKQPETGVAVVVEPLDARRFEAAPKEPSTPSLKEPSDLSNTHITSRALARKRGGFGHAFGDVLLAPPQTAASLVGDAVKAGLRDSGYRVLEPSDPGYAAAPRIAVRISEFWTWVTPGFASIKLDHVANITLDSNLPSLRTAAPIVVRETKGYGAIFESDWGPFIASSLVKLREQVRSTLAPKTAEAAPAVR